MAKLTALTKGTAGINSGASCLAKMRRIESIQIREEFSQLFPIRVDVLERLTGRIKEYGYDKSQPVHVWREEDVLIDGHTRREAALRAGLSELPVYEHSFASIKDAMEYAVACQTDRRNLNDAELFCALEKLDELKCPGRKKDTENTEEKGKSAVRAAKILGTSPRKVERARTVRKASEEIRTALKNGEMSINQAYEATRNEQRAAAEKNDEGMKTTSSQSKADKIRLLNDRDLAQFLASVQTQEKKTEAQWLEEIRKENKL